MSRKFQEADAQLKAAMAVLNTTEAPVAATITDKGEVTMKQQKKTPELVLSASRIANPALMEEVVNTGIYKHLLFNMEWVTDPETKKRRRIKKYAGLADYEDGRVAPMPKHSPLKAKVDAGEIRYCRIAMVGQDQKVFKGHKYDAFETFANIAAGAGYLCIQPDWKDTELQIFYETPENLAKFFGITVEKLYKSLGKLHKWLKLIKTPTKVQMNSDTYINVLYYEEGTNEYGRDKNDGDVWCSAELEVYKTTGGMMWEGFCEFMQFRSFIETDILLKGLVCFNEARFMRKARMIKKELGISPKKYQMIINQHSVKFDRIGLEHGKIYKIKADQLFRFINARFKPGTSTLGAQLVAMNDMQIAKGILMEHELESAAVLIKSLAKGLPFAWMHIARDYNKVSTNKFVELMFCINRDKYGWRLAKVYSKHNQNVSFLEAEWRKRISSVQINTESAYAYTDERCDEASQKWFEKYGEWKSFAVVSPGTELNEKGEIITIKYPLHSAPCIASHTALRVDIFNPESKLIYGPHGGVGLSTLYERSVNGLDDDGDKLAKATTKFTVPVEFDLSKPKPEDKGEPVVIVSLEEAVAHMLAISKKAEADARAIGFMDLGIRYGLFSAHLNDVKITPEMSSAIGELREGGIKGGVKGDLKGIADSSTHIDVAASLEAGTLGDDILKWFAGVTGHVPPALSAPGMLNKENLAEICHFLVVKNAGCDKPGHADKFLWRMQELLPAYMEHKGNKKNNPWHEAFVLMHEGIKPEYLTFEKNDSKILQDQYKECWKVIEQSYRHYSAKGEWTYSFDLEQVKGFANWIRAYYSTNSNGILADFRGVTRDGEQLKVGDFDKERRSRRFLRLNRIVKFMLAGLKPHQADLGLMPNPIIPDTVLDRCLWFRSMDADAFAYLKFAHVWIGSVDFNTRGDRGNSGGVCWSFPASVVHAARAMYYDVTPKGQKEKRNPFLDIAKGLAEEFDAQWIERSLEWLDKRPYADEFPYISSDSDDFEESEIADDYFESDDEYDSID